MGVEHFVIAPLPPTDHLQVKIMCISKSMKLITPPFSQTQRGVAACGINIKKNVDSKQMSTDDNTFWQECFTFSEINIARIANAVQVTL